MSLLETMAMTGHHSVAPVMGDLRAESALGSRVTGCSMKTKPIY
ncbi:hypothetical protein [Variovorax guangxiensis]|nr:hypothetical protein [Variovorax guangxiensis]